MDGAPRPWRAVIGGVLIALAPAFGSTAAEAANVDVELVLAVDTSSSMTPDELALQRRGYAAAFRSPDVIRAIADGSYGRVAVTYFEWGASNSRRVIVPWTPISSKADADRVADTLEQAKTRNLLQTSISGAIRFGRQSLDDNAYQGLRRIIDISGDGPNNQGGLVTQSRDDAVEAGITINGLPLMLRGAADIAKYGFRLDDYYADCVIGGPLAFSLPVSSWNQFTQAVRRKLVLELSAAAPTLWRASGTRSLARDGSTATAAECSVGERIWIGEAPTQ